MLLLSYGGGWIFTTPPEPDYLHAAPLKFVVELFAFGTFLIFFLVSFRIVKSAKSENRLYRPSTYRNPFERGQLLVNFDLGGLMVMALALGYLTKTASIGPPSFFWELPFFFGLGVWVGVRVCAIFYRNELF